MKLSPFTTNIDKEISQQKKFYFADTGILNVLAGNRLSKGQIFENAIAAQLKPMGSLQYYQRKSGQEIDLIFNEDTAIEVKETPLQQDKKSLTARAAGIGIDHLLLIGHHPPQKDCDDFIWGGSGVLERMQLKDHAGRPSPEHHGLMIVTTGSGCVLNFASLRRCTSRLNLRY
jgi:hypothetical protein